MNLYDLTLTAAADVAVYCNPDIDEWRVVIDPVLNAAGECVVGSDKVDDISVIDNTLTISTSYSVRCCSQTNHMSIPITLLKDDNPVQAAVRYKLGKELTEAKNKMEFAQRTLTEYTAKVACIEAELSAVPL